MAKIIIRRPEEPSKKQQFHKEIKKRNTAIKASIYILPLLAASIILNIYFILTR